VHPLVDLRSLISQILGKTAQTIHRRQADIPKSASRRSARHNTKGQQKRRWQCPLVEGHIPGEPRYDPPTPRPMWPLRFSGRFTNGQSAVLSPSKRHIVSVSPERNRSSPRPRSATGRPVSLRRVVLRLLQCNVREPTDRRSSPPLARVPEGRAQGLKTSQHRRNRDHITYIFMFDGPPFTTS
jgi:hypothetical protein